jgi:uncharacterized membrane protein
MEDELFGKWFPRIGALALVLGSGFGFKYAIDQGWIGPRLRVMVGFLVSSILIGIGDWARKRDWSAYGGAITGGGVALLYLTLWATVGVYDLLPPSVAFVCLVGVSGLGCALALRHDSQALAMLAVIGGFINPFVTGAGAEMPQGLYLYTLTVDLAVVALSFVRPWRLLEKVAFTASWVVFEVGDGRPVVSLVAATGIFVMFGALPYLRVLLKREQGVTDFAFAPANGLIYYFAVFVRLNGDLEALRGPFTLGMAGLFLIAYLLIRNRTDDDAVSVASGAMAFGFLTLWSPIQLGVEQMALGWAVQALLLFGVALLTKDATARIGGWFVLIMSSMTHLVFVAIDPVGSINEGYGRFVFVLIIATLYIAAYVEGEELWSDVTDFAIMGASAISILWLSLEVYSYVSHQGSILPNNADLQFGLSGVWALYAGGLLIVGILFRARIARLMSLVLFGATLVKMAVHDLWLLDSLQRLIGFVGIGVLLLACSLMYHRFKPMLFGTQQTEVAA